MADEKEQMTELVAHAKYSEAQTEIEQLERMMGVVDSMNVKGITVSHVDDRLFNGKKGVFNDVRDLINSEGDGAVR